MTGSKRLGFYIIFAILLSFLFISCAKEKQGCISNCAPIRATGRIFDTSNNKGMPNVLVKIYWKDAGFCFISCSPFVVASGFTNSEGYFNIHTEIDTMSFGRYWLHIGTKVQEGYMNYARYADENIERSAHSYKFFMFRNLKFVMYQKTNLTIRLKRTSTMPFQSLRMGYQYSPTTFNGTALIDPNDPTSLEITVPTAANIFTKVQYRKVLGILQFVDYIDSIQCTTGTNNFIELQY